MASPVVGPQSAVEAVTASRRSVIMVQAAESEVAEMSSPVKASVAAEKELAK